MKKDQELLDAARIGNFTLIEKLLAARSRSSTIVASLGIKVGANVNCQDHSGYTPLHHAALNGHKLVVQYILQHAASVNINDVKGNFPLHLAAWSGNHEIVRTLLTHGPSIAKVNEKNGDNETALHCASQHGHTDTVEVLLDNGADPSVRNVHHESPLDLASQYGRLDVVRLLLYYQPSLLSRFPECFSPLHLASRNGHKEVAELLLAHGADINQSGENGSALHEAALFGKLEVVKLLLSRGANPHTLDPQSRSPLELMKQLNTQTSREIAQLILSRMQEGEDYEPLNPVANLALTSLCLRRFLNEPTTPDSSHTHTDMMRAFVDGTWQLRSDPPVKPPKVLVENHEMDNLSRPNSVVAQGDSIQKGLWGKGGFTLRRSASARSSKSLPRLPSTRSRSPGSSLASPDLNPPTLQQHHPSSNMFPVSPMNRRSVALRRSSSSLPDANSSLLSLPTIPTIQPLKRSDTTKPFTREPLKSEDDSVFLPSNSLGSRRRRSNKSRRARARSMDWHSPSAYHVMSNRDPPTDVDGIVFNVPSSLSRSFSNSKEKIASSGSTSMSPVNRPKKPARTKLSTLCSPPPIPPKPCSMIQASKVRPPSPENPPPDDESDSAEEDCVEEQEIEVFVAPSSCENGSGCEKSLKDTPHVHIGAESENLKHELTASHDLHSNTPSRGDVVNTLTAVSGTSTPMRPPSPAISPPSPHSAMIEISQTLQDALHSEDGVDGIVACDNLKSPCLNDPIATESNHSSNVIVMTCSAAKQSEISTTSSTASVMHVASSHSRSEDVNSQDKTGNLLKNKNSLNGTQQCLPRNTKSVQENLVALKPDNENTRNNDHAPYPMQSSSDHIIKVTKESIAHNSHEGLVEQMDKLKPITAIKPEPKPRIKPKPRISSTTSSISAGEEVASDRLGPVKTDTNHTEDAVSFILCYTGGAKVKHARIRSTRSTESGSGSTSTEPDPIAQVQSEDSNSLFIEDLGGISINSRTHNEVQVQYDSSWGIPTESKSRISTSLEKEDLPPIDSSSIGSWDDALSDRTEDLEIPDAVRKFRGLIRGASYRSRSKSRYPTVARDISPYEYDRYGDSSDGYGEDILENFPGVNPVLLGDNIALVDSMTRETTPKRSEADKSVAERTAIRYSSELFSRQQKIPSSRRSDGRDSPMSSSSAEEYDRVTQTAQCKISHSTTSGSDGETSKEIRTNSFYDNNSAQHSSNPDLSSLKISDTESIGRLPDLETIVDAVTAVRSRSTRGSKSDSTSSASSTLAKPPTLDPVSSVPKDEVTVADDKDEWAEIANIMSSLGGGLNKGGGVYAKEFEKTFWQIMTGSDLPQQISTWLTDLGLSQYEKVLTGNGFDDVDFLADDILEEQDLIDMDITESSHRRRILESAKNLPKLHSLPQADSPLAPCSVGDWLSSLHLPEYEAVFVEKGYHSMAQVRTMAEFEIKPLVVNRGHLKRLMASLRSADQQKSPSHRRSSRKSSTSQTKSSPPLSRSPLLETVNFFKDYNTIVNSRATTTSSNTIGTDTVSSTSSSSFSNICSDPHHSTGNRVPRNGQIPASIPETTPSNTDSGSRNHNCRKESRGDNDHSHDTGREGDRLTSESSSRRSRSYRHQSSQDSDSRKPRSRSGSSTRLNNSELSVFVDNVKVKNNKTSRSDSQKSKNHRSKHRRSSSSSRRRGSEQKENLRTMSVRVTDIPNTERATSLASGGALNLRPPNETTREVSVSSWRHTADVLINSCCNYQACYLGSMLIPELKGVASTMEACSKMKKSTDALKKIPTITLSINYKGVKFIDFKSKHEIAEHEIQNISFASQDSEDRATFAYITHDVKTGHHYCHVFRVTTMDMAYEIILTLGQAFEVVYQLILKDQEMKGNDLT